MKSKIQPATLSAKDISKGTKPWDARLAQRLVKPLEGSWVRPNHLTTLRLMAGLGAAVGLAIGTAEWANWGAFLFVLSNFLDHTDGELARLSGKTSVWGHRYDLACDAIIHILLFVSIGWGLRSSQLGNWSLGMGILAGLSVATIFHLRHEMEQRWGKKATRQPHWAGFEVEDILYLFPVVTLLNGLMPFLVAATIGAPIFAIWVIRQIRMKNLE